MHLRLARPVLSLERSVAMYCAALGMLELGCFEDHAGFDGVMIGAPGLPYHFEFTHCRAHPVAPTPTPEDPVVFHVPDASECQRQGRTFMDMDGYRVVLQQAEWRVS